MGNFKKDEYSIDILGASFRSAGEILELAGCDFLTISPALLDELQKTEGQVTKKLDANQPRDESITKVSYIDNEADFRSPSPPLIFIVDSRFSFNEDQMAVEKLSEGIRYANSATAILIK
jgi:transaldolase